MQYGRTSSSWQRVSRHTGRCIKTQVSVLDPANQGHARVDCGRVRAYSSPERLTRTSSASLQDAHRFIPTNAYAALKGHLRARCFARAHVIEFPEQCVDGLVHEAAGARLALAADYPVLKGEERERIRCRPGRAAVSRSYGGLVQNFGLIVHAVAPRFDRGVDVEAWRTRLTSTWHSAMSKAHESGATFAVSPVLGSGCLGAPYADAADVAASAALSWRGHDDGASPTTALALQIVVQDDADADTLVGAIEARGATRID
ncbi:Macro domain-containing protein [Pseudoscourfieldia marina]